MITIDKKNNKDGKKTISDTDIVDFYKTSTVKDINDSDFTVKTLIEQKSQRQLLIEKEQAEAVIAEYTEKLTKINELLTLLNK